MSTPVQLGIVGCGAIAHAHAGAAAGIPQCVQFAACCDINRAVAEAWASAYGVSRVYTDYAEMIATERLDAVVLATWPNQHGEQIARCLDAGARNILCEKALALTGQEALEIYDRVTAAGAWVMEGFMYRHHPAIRSLERLIAEGAIGDVDNVRGEFGWYDAETDEVAESARNWRQRKDRGGGVPYDATCYAVNACGHFCGGLPVRAFATGTISPAFGTISRLFGVIDYSNGRTGLVGSSKKQQFIQELQIEGAAGVLYLPIAWTINADIVIEKRRSEDWHRIISECYPIGQSNAYQRQLENVCAVIRGEDAPVVPLAQSVVNTYALEALVTSVLERRPVDIVIPERVRP